MKAKLEDFKDNQIKQKISQIMAPFGCADKPAEKHCWLICCERKTFFRVKKQAEKYGLYGSQIKNFQKGTK
jgi:hypothetical protein